MLFRSNTLTTGDASSTAYAGVIGGAGGLVKQGSGSFTLSGANSFTGAATVSAGSLALSGGSALADTVAVSLGTAAANLTLNASERIGSLAGVAATTVTLGANTLTTGDASSTAYAGVIGGTGGLVKQGSGSFTLSGSNSFIGPVTVSAGALALSGGAALADSVAVTLGAAAANLSLNASERIGSLAGLAGTTVTLGGNTLTTGDATNTSYAGVIGGSGGLVKQGTGTFTLSGANSYTGTATVSVGTLALSGGAALADSVAVVLDTAAANLALNANERIGSLAGVAATTVALGSSTLTTGDAGNTTFAGGMVGTGGLTKLGTGSFTLSGVNTFTGAATVSAGALALSGGAALADTVAVNLDTASANLTLGASERIGSLTGVASTTVTLGANTLTTGDATNTAFAGVIDGTGGLIKRGTGTFSMSGANTFTGAAVVSAGSLALAGSAALADTVAVTIDTAGANLTLDASERIGSLAGVAATTVTLGSSTLTTGNASNTAYAGVIGGAGGLIKQGSGTLTLSGANTFTGPATVASGSLALSGGAALADTVALALGAATAQLVLNAGETVGSLAGVAGSTVALGSQTLTTGDAGSTAFAGVIGGSGGLVKRGSGTFSLTGANTFSGSTTLSAGTLSVNNAAVLGNSAVTLANAAGVVLDLQGSSSIGSLAGGGALGGNVALGSHALSTGGDAASTTFAGAIGGAGSLVKQGSGTLTLTGVNTFTGLTDVAAGSLALSGGSALANTDAVSLSASGANLRLDTSETIGSLAGVAGSTVTLGSNILTTGDASNTVHAGVIGGTGGLVKQGGGSFSLTGANTYSGATTVNAGTLALNNAAVLRNSAVTLANAAGVLLGLQGSSAIGSLAGGGALGGNVALGVNTLSTGADNTSTRFDGVVGGSGGLTKQGSGVFTLAGANTFTGSVDISAGTLALSGGAALADTLVVNLSAAGADLSLNASETIGALAGEIGSTVTLGSKTLTSGNGTDTRFSGVIGGSGNLTKQGSGRLTLAGANTFTGSTTLTAGTLALAANDRLADGSRVVVQAGSFDLGGFADTVAGVQVTGGSIVAGALTSTSTFDVTAGAISASLRGTVGLTKTGPGTLTLSGANTYTGATSVDGGTLALGASDVIANASALTVNGATLDIGANSDTVASVSLQNGGTITGSSGVLTSTAAFDLRSGTVAATLGGTAGAIKSTAATVTLSGLNTYTGTTTVQDGLLQLAGAGRLNASSSARVEAAGTLALAGDQTLANFSLSGLANGSGILTVTDTAIVGGVLDVTLVTSTLTATGNSTLNQATTAGTLTVNSGNLTLGAPDLLSNSAVVTVATPATLTLTGSDSIGSLSLAGTLAGSGTLTAPTYALSGGSTLANAHLGSGALSSSGSSRLNGLAAADTVTVNDGSLTLRSGGSTLTATPAVTVGTGASPASLLLQGHEVFGSLAGNGNGLVGLGSSSLGTGNALNTSFAGSISGGAASSLDKQGSGTLLLSGASSYTGSTTVNAGSLAVSGSLASAALQVQPGGALALLGPQVLAANATLAVASGGSASLSGAQTLAGLTLAGTLAGAGQLTAPTYALTGGSSLANAQLGSGALSSSGNSTLGGASAADSVRVSEGSLTLRAGGASFSAAPAVTVGDGSSAANLVLLGNETFGNLAGNGRGSVSLGSATLSTGNAVDTTFAGTLSGAAASALVKQGGDTFTLAGASSYTGTTTVNAGSLVVSGSLVSPTLQVNGGGTLALLAPQVLAPTATLAVASGGTARLAGAQSLGDLVLSGTLTGSGSLTAPTYALAGGNTSADASLGAGTLTSTGNSTLAGLSGAATVRVDSGRLTLASADRLNDSADVSVAGPGSLTLTGDDLVGKLVLRGLLDGSGTLTAPTYLLDGGRAVAGLGSGALTSTGSSRLDGTTSAASVDLGNGSLTLGSANRLLAAPAVTLQANTRLVLGGDDRAGSLASSAASSLVDLGAGTLSTGAGASTTFAGVIQGDGGLIKQGAATTFGLTGANTFKGRTWVADGVLSVGEGGTTGSMATSNYLVDGLLRFNRSDAVVISQAITGPGVIEQAGGAGSQLTLSSTGNANTGQTRVLSGRLLTGAAETLSNTSDVRVAVGAELVLAGNETVKSLDADGTLTIASLLQASGALNLKGAVTATGGAAVALQAQQIDAINPGNRWGSSVAINTTGAVNLSAGTVDGKAGSTLSDLKLGALSVAGGNSRIDAGLIELTALTSLTGGTLVLDASSGAVFVAPGVDLIGKLTPANRQIAFTQDVVTQAAGSRIVVADGAQLQVVASKGGSVALLTSEVGAVPTAANVFNGGLSVRAGGKADGPTPWDANKVTDAKGVAGLEYSLQNRVRISGSQVTIGSAGIEADVVTIKADAVATPGAVQIVARLPYDNLVGTTSSLPGLTFELTPASFLTTGSYGLNGSDININVGSKAFGPRTTLPVDSGFVTLLPRGAAKGSTAVFLKGPLVAGSYGFFYDGSGVQSEVPVFYNGVSAVTPQVQGSISSTVSVSESARKERFEEAVRTENVALRLRAGVIAEVGPGVPATTTSGSLDKMRPPRCEPATGTLACDRPSTLP